MTHSLGGGEERTGRNYWCSALGPEVTPLFYRRTGYSHFPEPATRDSHPLGLMRCVWLVTVWPPALGSVYRWSHCPGLLDTVFLSETDLAEGICQRCMVLVPSSSSTEEEKGVFFHGGTGVQTNQPHLWKGHLAELVMSMDSTG